MRFVLINRETLQRSFGAIFSNLTRAVLAGDGLLQKTTKITGKAGHSY
jgi:hypothetical protein